MKDKEQTKQRKFKALSIALDGEASEVLRRLRCEYGINVSRTINLLLKEKLTQLDNEKISNVN